MSTEGAAPPLVVPRSEHPITRDGISKEALKVLDRLATGGHRAYLVGGAVRDLMLARQPKDFDIATDARPNEIRRLFRNARIIGRRFRLAHILFGPVVVEVSTFRSAPRPAGNGEPESDDLLIREDNVWGTPREDAYRRDFTVNALFYDSAGGVVVDYVGGIADLQRRLIRTIGDPMVRFREDPVRMMRACELAGRLGFGIDATSQHAMHDLRRELEKASAARLAEEWVALLRCGRSGAALQWMLDLGLLQVALPEADAMVAAGARGLGDFGKILPTLDHLIAAGRKVSDGGLLAALLLPEVLLRRFDVEATRKRSLRRDELAKLIRELAQPFFERYQLSRVRKEQILGALDGFFRLCEIHRGAAERQRVAHGAHFADALWLFELLTEATGEGHEALAQWNAAARGRPVLAAGGVEAGAAAVAGAARPRKRRPRRRRR